MTNFAVYTKPGCPYCTKIKQVLRGERIFIREYQLDKDFDRESFYGEFGEGSTFPQVLLNSKVADASMLLNTCDKKILSNERRIL